MDSDSDDEGGDAALAATASAATTTPSLDAGLVEWNGKPYDACPSAIARGDERWADSKKATQCMVRFAARLLQWWLLLPPLTGALPTRTQKCGTKFNFYTRKHHCRACGFVVCNDCSPYRAVLPGVTSAVRVCRHCYARQFGVVWDEKVDTAAFLDAADRNDVVEVEARLRRGQPVDGRDVSGCAV